MSDSTATSAFSFEAYSEDSPASSTSSSFRAGDKFEEEEEEDGGGVSLEEIEQLLKVLKEAAANGTRPCREWIYDVTEEWPVEWVLEGVFVFYPKEDGETESTTSATTTQGGKKGEPSQCSGKRGKRSKKETLRSAGRENFEHEMEEDENGRMRPTTYSRWYFEWAIEKWDVPMEVKMKWDEGVFKLKAASTRRQLPYSRRHAEGKRIKEEMRERERMMKKEEDVGPRGESW